MAVQESETSVNVGAQLDSSVVEKLPMKLRVRKIMELFATVNSLQTTGCEADGRSISGEVNIGLDSSSSPSSLMPPHSASRGNERLTSLAAMDTLLDCLTVLFEECDTPVMRRDKNIAEFVGRYRQLLENIGKLRVSMDEFEVLKVIGRGGFGDVEVVRHRASREIYAMKTLKKTEMLQQENTAFFKEERSILASSCSHWLTALHFAFQDRERLYLVMDFHPGGDLLSLLSKYDDVFEEPMARFYLGEIVLAIESLHELGFVHRDIKPDNVLIDATGHIKLADFGSSAFLNADGIVTSEIAVGTPDYMPPEILNASKGKPCIQGKESDWWSFGAVMYEMLFGNTPFYAESLMGTYRNIMNAQTYLTFPDDIETGSECKDLIRLLFVKREMRPKVIDIKAHPFFSGFDWDNIRLSVSPYIPSLSGLDDTSNFDDFRPKSRDIDINRSSAFSGKQLPFIGFTFTRSIHVNASGDESPFELMSPQRNIRSGTNVGSSILSPQRHSPSVDVRSNETAKELEETKRRLNEVTEEKKKLQSSIAEVEEELSEITKASNVQKGCNTVMIGQLAELRDTNDKLTIELSTTKKQFTEVEKEFKLKSIDLRDIEKKLADVKNAYSALIEQTKTREMTESSEMECLRANLEKEVQKRLGIEKKLNQLEKEEVLHAYKIEELESFLLEKTSQESASSSPSKMQFKTPNSTEGVSQLHDKPVEYMIAMFERKIARVSELKQMLKSMAEEKEKNQKEHDIEILKLTQTNQQQAKLIDFLQNQASGGATPKKKTLSRKVIPTPSDVSKRHPSSSWKENRENKLLAKERKQLECDLDHERAAKLAAIKELTHIKSRFDSMEQDMADLKKEAAEWKKAYTELVVKCGGRVPSQEVGAFEMKTATPRKLASEDDFVFAVPRSTKKGKKELLSRHKSREQKDPSVMVRARSDATLLDGSDGSPYATPATKAFRESDMQLTSGKKSIVDITQRLRHNIPHRFSTYLNIRSVKCTHCGCGIGFGRTAAKCNDCGIISHTKCMDSISPTCGLPADFLSQLHSLENEQQIGGGDNERKAGKLTSSQHLVTHIADVDAYTGWLKIPKAKGVRSGWERVFLVLKSGTLSLFEKEVPASDIKKFSEFSSHKPKATFYLGHSSNNNGQKNAFELIPSVQATEMIHVAESDLPFVFQLRDPQQSLSVLCPNLEVKREWLSEMTKTLCVNSNVPTPLQSSRLTCIRGLCDSDPVDIVSCAVSHDHRALVGTCEGLYSIPIEYSKADCEGNVSLTDPQVVRVQLPGIALETQPVFQVEYVERFHKHAFIAIVGKAAILAIKDGESTPCRTVNLHKSGSAYLYGWKYLNGALYVAVAMEEGKIEVVRFISGDVSSLAPEFVYSYDVDEPCSCIELVSESTALLGGLREFKLVDFSQTVNGEENEPLSIPFSDDALEKSCISTQDFVPISIFPITCGGVGCIYILCSSLFVAFYNAIAKQIVPFALGRGVGDKGGVNDGGMETSALSYEMPQQSFALLQNNILVSVSGDSQLEIVQLQVACNPTRITACRVPNQFYIPELNTYSHGSGSNNSRAGAAFVVGYKSKTSHTLFAIR
eukprot:Nk52_evm19s2391 gene=Nk52_evmTU19s2391